MKGGSVRCLLGRKALPLGAGVLLQEQWPLLLWLLPFSHHVCRAGGGPALSGVSSPPSQIPVLSTQLFWFKASASRWLKCGVSSWKI